MDSIEPSSAEHVPAVRSRWAEAAFSTAPLRPEAASAAVAEAYRAAGLEPPTVVLTAGSPLGGALIAAALEVLPIGGDQLTAGEYVGPQVNSGVIDAVSEALRVQRVSPRRVNGIDWNDAKADIWNPLVHRVRRTLLVPLLAMNADNNDDFAEDLAQGAVFKAALKGLAGDLNRRFGAPAQEPLTLHALMSDGSGAAPELPEDLVDDVHDHFHDQFARAVPGGFEVHVLAYLDYFRAFDDINDRAHDIAGLGGVAKESGLWWPFERAAVLTEHPEILHLDRNGRPHCANGPAIVYRDGWKLYAWHGSLVPLRVILRDWSLPDLLADHSLDEEGKRCTLERLGWDWILDATDTTPMASIEDPEQPGEHLELCELPEEITELLASGETYGDNDFDPRAARFLVYSASGRRLALAVDGEIEDPIEAVNSLADWADAEFAARAAQD